MIILDTNILSELMRGTAAERRVVAWVDSQPGATLRITAITIAEISFGVARLPGGRRKDIVAEAAAFAISRFAILDFDAECGTCFGPMMAERQSQGRPMPAGDGFIAAIALRHGAALATRNTRDFRGCGIDLVDPWQP